MLGHRVIGVWVSPCHWCLGVTVSLVSGCHRFFGVLPNVQVYRCGVGVPDAVLVYPLGGVVSAYPSLYLGCQCFASRPGGCPEASVQRCHPWWCTGSRVPSVGHRSVSANGKGAHHPAWACAGVFPGPRHLLRYSGTLPGPRKWWFLPLFAILLHRPG